MYNIYMIEKINKKLISYCESEIIPKYKALDLAHQPDHVKTVIEKSLDIASTYDVDLNMVYMIAVFHDLGLLINRATHHIEGGRLLENDPLIKEEFYESEIRLMKEAIEDHRASNNHPPRSIYGKIISEADRLIDIDTIIQRSFYYQFDLETNHSFDHIYPSVQKHIKEKYGRG